MRTLAKLGIVTVAVALVLGAADQARAGGFVYWGGARVVTTAPVVVHPPMAPQAVRVYQAGYADGYQQGYAAGVAATTYGTVYSRTYYVPPAPRIVVPIRPVLHAPLPRHRPVQVLQRPSFPRRGGGLVVGWRR